jgi:DNA-binding SARP family transcriptional activator
MIPIRLRTFGSVYLTRDGEMMSGAAGQRRLLAILAVVAVAGDEGISRDKLLGLLWTEADPDKARHALTQSLYHIKKALGVERVFAPGVDLRLDPASISSDVGEFQRAVRERRFDDVVVLYTGPFVDGFNLTGAAEFDVWASAERSRLARQFGEALLVLADRANAAGDASSERRLLERLVEHDPLDAKAVSRLLKCLIATGDRAEALQLARVYEMRMREELDLPPDDIVLQVLANLRRASPTPPSPGTTPAFEGASRGNESPSDVDSSSASANEVGQVVRFRRYWIAGIAAAAAVFASASANRTARRSASPSRRSAVAGSEKFT